MQLMKTEKTEFTEEDILNYIDSYENSTTFRELTRLWDYYGGDNPSILERETPDPNNPDNKTPIPYGRKIIKTFTGYAYRPGYITYKPVKKFTKQDKKMLQYDTVTNPEGYTPEEISKLQQKAHKALKESEDTAAFWEQLSKTMKENNEIIKTSRSGRNMGIFGVAYELLYIDGKYTMENKLPIEASVRFFNVDPRELILFYDFSSEPKKIAAIRFYMVEETKYKVEVYYKDRVVIYDRILNKDFGSNIGKSVKKWELKNKKELPNFFGDVPVVAYYFGDEMESLIKPVAPLIDDYDILISDSMNEFDRFAHAYLIMKKFGLTNPVEKKNPQKMSFALRFLKRFRVFENLPEGADIKFLTKDIPTGFVEFTSKFLREQIHIQSHVPDFTSEKFTGASGIAIQRLLFDFENVCASAEADFNVGLYERIRLISKIYKILGLPVVDPGNISISHKRNIPLNLLEFAQTASVMKGAGFSRYLVADVMPDDVIPDVEEELKRQDEDMEAIMPDLTNYPQVPVEESEEETTEEEV